MMNLFLIFIVIPLQFAYSNDQNIMSAINFLEMLLRQYLKLIIMKFNVQEILRKKMIPIVITFMRRVA